MPDWTERLTEKERTDLHETDYESATTTELQDLHLSALRTVAALRALVGEKDGALVCSYAMRGLDPCYRSRGTPCVPCHVRALTEDDMRKRMEE